MSKSKEIKVCLIVDNPIRDLAGLVHLAADLSRSSMKVYLVPQYDQAFEIPALLPDYVFVNYARQNNAWLIKYYWSLGIKVIILDTEGLPGLDHKKFASRVKTLSLKPYIAKYLFWGENQAQAFKDQRVFDSTQIQIVGNPRYDFCYPELQDALGSEELEEYILINTNFPLANPRFSEGSSNEIDSVVQAGYGSELAHRVVGGQKKAFKEMLELIKKILRKFPDERVVVRPHPFESLTPYTDALGLHKNCEVTNRESSLEAIYKCKLLIHLNCMTAVEAFMLGKISLTPQFLNSAENRELGAFDKCSIACKDFEEVAMSIQGSISEMQYSQQVENLTKDFIKRNFNFPSQKCSVIVEEVLREDSCRSSLYKSSGALARRLFYMPIRQMARIILGAKGYYSLKAIFKDELKNGKSFKETDVSDLLTRISVSLGRRYVVSSAKRSDYPSRRLARGSSLLVEELSE